MAACIFALWVALTAVRPAEAQVPQLVESITPDSATQIAVGLGWKPGKMTDSGEEFEVEFLLPSGVPVYFVGLACLSDEVEGCPEWQLYTAFGVGAAGRATEVSEAISYLWLSDWIEAGEVVVISRMDFLYGGVSSAHLSESFFTFGALADEAAKTAFPCGLPVDGHSPDC